MRDILKQTTFRASRKLLGLPKRSNYSYHSGHTVIDDFSQFSGLSTKDIERKIKSYKTLTKNDWDKAPGRTFQEKAKHFYGCSGNYIFDLLSANFSKRAVVSKLNNFTPQILNSIKEHRGVEFLDFGGGTGVFCEIVSEMGKHVTYLDVAGQVFDFAKWRFEKHKILVQIISSDQDKPNLEKQYDIIFTDAVIEHLPDPYSAIHELNQHVKEDGLLILLVDLAGKTSDMPMHRDIDIRKLHDIINHDGLLNEFGRDTFCSIWRKPPTC